ncbi:MAG TPA: hypothetical protein VMK31_06490 [Sphingomicrobium sp.]|nr:hypothetical protein [Sphingomicrobium sp.]
MPIRPARAILIGYLIAFPISLLLGFIATTLLPEAQPPQFDVEGPAAIVALVLFAPIAETLIMGAALLFLLLFLPPTAAIIVSAVGWGIAHSMLAPMWGLIIWWPFLIFSTLFVAWRVRSLALAFAIPMCVHALQNLLPALLIARGMTG